MRKFILFSLFISALPIVYVSCKKNDISSSPVLEKTSTEKVYALMQKRFGFKTAEFDKNESQNSKLIQALVDNKFVQENVIKNGSSAGSVNDAEKIILSQLNFKSVSKFIWNNGNISFSIPFSSNAKENFIVTFNSTRNNDFLLKRLSILINNVNNLSGNGDLEQIVEVNGKSERIKTIFSLGKKISETSTLPNSQVATKNPFQTCLDTVYNDICDGFWGCMAWYTNPGVPVAAIAYCTGYVN